MGFFIRVLVNIVGLGLGARIFPGALGVEEGWRLVGAALLLAVANATLRPVLLFLALPLNVLTLGLATLGVNTLLLYLVVWFLRIPHGGVLALAAVSLLLSVLSVLLAAIMGP
ncbi:MAG: phage holin family protein [Armatimonadota bacterium]|nr:phage holin family protein [Armatimonadota bacterium]MDR7439918.1 phage holin family protein [Armatimonadota bacterium]MDR7562511.1 phage holin family protein [Armatimonadota bacterium]MDR7566790.1 phage holin family protein [Armatimonadota bacterium]MDR7601395.1 phage holin family protein [Armatimonadota bacterium]